LMAIRDDTDFCRGRATGVLDQTARPKSGLAKRPSQGGRRLVTPDETYEIGTSSEGHDVVRDVGGAADASLFAAKLHDWDRRFRRNACDSADQELIEHHVADDKD
jgi:hypothetical protein